MARSVALFCLALVCATAAFRELRAGAAALVSASGTPDALRDGLRHTPEDPAKWRRLGIALIRTNSDAARPALERAVELAPNDADALVGLAYEAERTGAEAEAERYYLRAAASSRRFQPGYALAGFYLRTGRLDRFWAAAAETASIPAADLRRIFRLAQKAGACAKHIPSLLKLRTDYARASYVAFALAGNEPEAAAAVAREISNAGQHHTLLLQLCERLIQAGSAPAALTLWNRLPGAERLDPAAGRSLPDGQFRELGNGTFQWRRSALPGISARTGGGAGLRVDFSGGQPEHGLILEKAAPVLPLRRYRLTVRYGTGELSGETGVWWAVAPWNKPSPAIATVALKGTPDGTAAAEFTTPAGCTLLRLTMLYSRVRGTVRIEGGVHLRSASLELIS